MKKAIILLAAVLSFGVADAQLLKSAYFMEGSVVRSNINPAFRPYRGYINLPAIGGTYIDFQGSLAFSDLFYPRDGKLVPFLDPRVSQDDFFNKIGINGREAYDFDMNVTTNLLGIGFHVGRSFFSLGWDADFAFGAAVPGDIFRFLKSGSNNSTFDLSSTEVSFESTSKVSLGYSLKLGGLTVGVRGNLKLGFMRANLSFDEMSAYVGEDKWSLDVNGVLDVVMPFKDRPVFVDENGNIDFGRFGDAIGEALREFRPIGTGYSFDLGAEYDLGFLKASLSILDLGKMTWNNNYVWRGRSQQNLSYEGFSIIDGEPGEDPEMPSIDDILQFSGERLGNNDKVITPMQATIAAGVEFNLLGDLIGLGLIYMDKNREFTSSAQLSANLTVRPLSWLSGALSYTFENYRNIGANSFNTFGASLNLHASWINIFLGTDYIINDFGKMPVTKSFKAPIPVNQKYFNFYVGISIPLARGKY